MGIYVYAYALILAIIWGIGYFKFAEGGFNHLLLFTAIIVVVVKNTEKNKTF